MSEPSLAMSAIQRWRQNVLEEYHQWKSWIEESETAFKEELKKWEQNRKQTQLMVSYFSAR